MKTLVCDNGTGYTKVGYIESKIPSVIFPTVVGRPIVRSVNTNSAGLTKQTAQSWGALRDIIIGDEVTENLAYLESTYPIVNGIIQNWDDMEHIWDYTFYGRFNIGPKKFNEARVGEGTESNFEQSKFSDTRLMMTEAPLNPKKNRQKMAEIIFEKYGFESMQIAIQAIMSLYSHGLKTGIVIDSGDGVTHICAVSDGYIIPHLTTRIDIAGRHVTSHLIKLLQEKGYPLNWSSDYESIQRLKEEKCYVAYDLKVEERLAKETTVLTEKYELPDGRLIHLDLERYHAPEALFQPEQLGKPDVPGLADCLFDLIQNKAEIDTRKEFYSHIVLSGGTTMYPGFSTRLQRELRQLYAVHVSGLDSSKPLSATSKDSREIEILKNLDINIIDTPNRMHSVYLGATIFARAIAQIDTAWVSQKDYHEKGAARCFG